MSAKKVELNKALFNLIHAEKNIDWEAINQLIEKGTAINALNEDGHNLLTYFLDELFSNGADFVLNDGALEAEKEFDRQLSVVNQLIALGVKANHIVEDSTCLDLAKFTYNYKLLEPLIAAGANPNRKSLEDGATILENVSDSIHACGNYPVHTNCLESMLQILEKYDKSIN